MLEPLPLGILALLLLSDKGSSAWIIAAHTSAYESRAERRKRQLARAFAFFCELRKKSSRVNVPRRGTCRDQFCSLLDVSLSRRGNLLGALNLHFQMISIENWTSDRKMLRPGDHGLPCDVNPKCETGSSPLCF
jgi:hypothetical protein